MVGYDEYGRPLAGTADPRLAGQDGYDEFGRPLAGGPPYAGLPVGADCILPLTALFII